MGFAAAKPAPTPTPLGAPLARGGGVPSKGAQPCCHAARAGLVGRHRGGGAAEQLGAQQHVVGAVALLLLGCSPDGTKVGGRAGRTAGGVGIGDWRVQSCRQHTTRAPLPPSSLANSSLSPPPPCSASLPHAPPHTTRTHRGVSEAAVSRSSIEKSRREEAAREGMKRSLYVILGDLRGGAGGARQAVAAGRRLLLRVATLLRDAASV